MPAIADKHPFYPASVDQPGHEFSACKKRIDCMVSEYDSLSLSFYGIIRLSPNCIYVILMGFLCVFPMGANIIAESLSLKKITEREAELLLSFCNNIGPVYFLSYVAITCPYYPVWLTFSVMYLLPLCYGLLLRYIFYRDIPIYNPRCSVIYYNADCPY